MTPTALRHALLDAVEHWNTAPERMAPLGLQSLGQVRVHRGPLRWPSWPPRIVVSALEDRPPESYLRGGELGVLHQAQLGFVHFASAWGMSRLRAPGDHAVLRWSFVYVGVFGRHPKSPSHTRAPDGYRPCAASTSHTKWTKPSLRVKRSRRLKQGRCCRQRRRLGDRYSAERVCTTHARLLRYTSM